MADIFSSPFIKEIDRQAKYEEGKPQQPTPKRNFQPEVDQPTVDIALGKDPAIGLTAQASPFLATINKKLDTIIQQAKVLEEEAVAIQKVQATAVPRDLIGAPQHIIDLLNETVHIAPGIAYSNTPGPNLLTEVQPCDMNCILDTAGYFNGDYDPNEMDRNLDTLKNAPGVADAVRQQAEDLTSSIDGWQMFLFMCRFILAYACHMFMGFLYCYFRGKLCLSWYVKVFGTKIGFNFGCIGDWIADDIICPIDRALQEIFGFGCAAPNNQCVSLDGSVPQPAQGSVLDLKIFPCCTCDDPTNQQSFRECVKQAVRVFTAPYYGGSGAKPCRACNPNQQADTLKDIKAKSLANTLADYFVNQGVVADADGRNPYNDSSTVNLGAMNSTKQTIGTARASGQAALKLSGTVNDTWQANPVVNATLCSALDDEAAKLGKFLTLGKVTKADIAQSLLDNVDTDLGPFLNEANQRRRLDIEGQNPPQTEPFKTIFETVDQMDQSIGRLLTEHRKTISNIKSFMNATRSLEFCCIIFTIVFLANLVRYGKLCPEDDLSRLFKYANKIGDSADVRSILNFLKLLRDVIAALNEEISLTFNFVGIGLPLGTLVKLLKHVVGNSVAAILATAFAPFERVLNQLSSLPQLQAQLNNNCPGVVDLLFMLDCGIKWLLDLVKELAAGLINISAQNIDLLPDMRVSSARFNFLKNLLALLDLLIALLASIGDCYSPEALVDLVTTGVAVQQVAGFVDLNKRLDQAGVAPQQFDTIGKENPLFPGASTTDAIDEAEVGIATPITTNVSFPVYPQEFKPFIDVVRKNNTLSNVRIREVLIQHGNIGGEGGVPLEDLGKDLDVTLDILADLGSPLVDREQLHQNLLNMVTILTSMGTANA